MIEKYKISEDEYKCPECGKIYCEKGIGTHIWRTHLDGKNRRLGGRKKGCVAWNKGLTKETDKRVAKNGESLTRNIKLGKTIPSFLGKHHKPGWSPKWKRSQRFTYISPIAGRVYLDSGWEFITAKFLDKISVKWERNKTRFKYINLQNKEATYCPDFYLSEYDTYLEVKGYESELDKCKWKQFKNSLTIWREKEINIISEIIK